MSSNDMSDLTPDEFKLYNKMAAGMDAFHAGFRDTWDQIYTTGTGGITSMTPEVFIDRILEWCKALDSHHKLEEEHVFPKLAVKMPVFKNEGPSTADLKLGRDAFDNMVKGDPKASEADQGYIHEQHRQIHAGLDLLHDYVKAWKTDRKSDVKWNEIKSMMDSFGGILWKHMNEEVELLGAANMRKYWTLDEMKTLPFKVKD